MQLISAKIPDGIVEDLDKAIEWLNSSKCPKDFYDIFRNKRRLVSRSSFIAEAVARQIGSLPMRE